MNRKQAMLHLLLGMTVVMNSPSSVSASTCHPSCPPDCQSCEYVGCGYVCTNGTNATPSNSAGPEPYCECKDEFKQGIPVESTAPYPYDRCFLDVRIQKNCERHVWKMCVMLKDGQLAQEMVDAFVDKVPCQITTPPTKTANKNLASAQPNPWTNQQFPPPPPPPVVQTLADRCKALGAQPCTTTNSCVSSASMCPAAPPPSMQPSYSAGAWWLQPQYQTPAQQAASWQSFWNPQPAPKAATSPAPPPCTSFWGCN